MNEMLADLTSVYYTFTVWPSLNRKLKYKKNLNIVLLVGEIISYRLDTLPPWNIHDIITSFLKNFYKRMFGFWYFLFHVNIIVDKIHVKHFTDVVISYVRPQLYKFPLCRIVL